MIVLSAIVFIPELMDVRPILLEPPGVSTA